MLLVVWSCKEDGGVNEPANDQTTEQKIANNLFVLNGAGTVYADTLIATQDSISALNAMGQWIVSQDAVKEAYYFGLNTVQIYFTNGLRSSILLIPTDENGRHLIRGGGAANQLSKYYFTTQSSSTKKIKNNKVLVLNPFTEQFDLEDYSEKKKQLESGEKLKVTLVTDKDVGLDDVNSFGDYGFIILNTHGLINGFKVHSKELPASPVWNKMSTKLYEDLPLDKFENGELELSYSITTRGKSVTGNYTSLLVTDNYIRNSSLDLKDVILFGNYCNSGHTADGPTTNNMAQALRSKGLATYYGYSRKDGVGLPVDTYFCSAMEDLLIKNLVNENDTTGIAHLTNSGTEQTWNMSYDWRGWQRIIKGNKFDRSLLTSPKTMYFNQYFDKNYKYGGCDSAYIAQKNFFLTANLGESNYEALSINASGQDVSQESSYILNSLRIKTVSNAILPNVTGVTAVMEIVGKNFDYTTGKFAIGGPDAPYAARLTYQVAGGTQHYSSEYAPPNSGELVITNFCENYIEGTFHFQAAHILPDIPILGVSNGKFQIFLRL
jgi:hypothetical protein